MKKIKYIIEYIIIKIFFSIFKIIGYETSSNLGGKLGSIFGPFFRDKDLILRNLKESGIGKDEKDRMRIIDLMWKNYGRILSEYPYIGYLRKNGNKKYISVEGQNILENIISKKKRVIFISGHFSNFELMAQHIHKSGVKLGALYRPLNNMFLNKTMENIRLKYICDKQITKSKAGTRELIKLIRNNYSIALMIDQRVSEGILSDFFLRKAYTTTIPAQLFKKYNVEIVPVNIERYKKFFFKIKIYDPVNIQNSKNILEITNQLNKILESMISAKPDQWIWSHNRWKI